MNDPLADLAQLDGVPRGVAVARAAVDAVLTDRGHRQVPGETTAVALLAGARASAQLSEDPQGWLPGAVRMATELPTLAPLLRTVPGQVLARLHTLLAHGRVPEAALGRLREAPGVAERTAALTRLLRAPTTAPALVLAAIAHAEIATLRPFGTGDGLIGRALEHLVLMDAGLDPRGLIVTEAGHLRLRAGYEPALGAYTSGTLEGVRTWLLHCLDAVVGGAEASPVNGPLSSAP